METCLVPAIFYPFVIKTNLQCMCQCYNCHVHLVSLSTSLLTCSELKHGMDMCRQKTKLFCAPVIFCASSAFWNFHIFFNYRAYASRIPDCSHSHGLGHIKCFRIYRLREFQCQMHLSSLTFSLPGKWTNRKTLFAREFS